MSTFPNPYSRPQVMDYGQSDAAISRFFSNVYAWMCAGLALTAVVAWWISTQPQLAISMGRSWFIFLLVEIGLVMAISYATEKISTGVATALFLLFAAVNGLTLSIIFLVYSLPSIAITFVTTAGMFGGMAFIGYVTKMDLTRFRGLLIMGLLGLVIGTVVNMFWANSTFHWILTYGGVALFLGLTAYDSQKLKHIAYATQDDPRLAARLSIVGSLILYLDFINLFILMLRILGSRRN
jgi:uncharacterized protein